jgi:hypothetical protein
MKKFVLLIVLLAVFGGAASAQVPPDWNTSPPRDTAAVKYSVGISAPQATEQAALKGAWQNAQQNFAASIGTQVGSQTDITVAEQGFEGDTMDAFTVTLETSSFSTQVRLTGVRELARKVERQGSSYIAYMLAAMSIEDWSRAARYIDNEEAAFLAYRFFAQRAKPVTPLTASGKPQGFEDFYTWLRNFCITAVVNADNGVSYLETMAQFSKKLYRDSLTFSTTIEGMPCCVIYDSPRYYDGFLRAITGSGIFTIGQLNGALNLTPKSTSALGAFTAYVSAMKDGSKLFVTGIEIITTPERRVVNTGNLVVNQFKAIAARQFNMDAVNFAIPAQYTQGESLDEDGIIAYIAANINAFPARYAAVCHTETSLEPGIAAFRMPPTVTARTSFTLYDIVTGERFQSDTVDTKGFVFSPANESEQTVLAESRRAIQFLYDAKNRGGLAGAMESAFGAK